MVSRDISRYPPSTPIFIMLSSHLTRAMALVLAGLLRIDLLASIPEHLTKSWVSVEWDNEG